MATVKTNIDKVMQKIASKFDLLKDREYFLRPLAIETIPNMKERIHRDGKATDGGAIGTYSSGYMRERERNNRSKDTKIIVSLTRQLENDWAVIGTSRGYGIGFNNVFNAQKSRWVEEIKKRIIFNLSAEEQEYIRLRITELTDAAFNS